MTDENTHAAAERPLTVREGTSLRSNCVTDDGAAVTWNAAADRFDLYQEHAANAGALVSDWNTTSQLPYNENHDRLILEQIRSLREGLRSDFRAVWTYSVTLTGEAYHNSEWFPAADYLADLTASWEATRKALYNALSDTTWSYCRAFDSDNQAYPIIRLIVMTTDAVGIEELYDSAVRAHIDNSPVASEELQYRDRCIRGGRSLGIDDYLADNLSCFGDNRGDGWQDRGFNSLLWATNSDRVTFSQNASEYIDPVETDAEPSMTETE